MFSTGLKRKRTVGLILLAVLLVLFLWFNRIPKLDTVEADLVDATAPAVRCFQGFCVDNAPGSTLFSRWWDFSLTYLELVSLGMIFAFLIAGLTEVFLFPRGGVQGSWAQGGLKGSLRGLLVGSAMNLCSACIVPITSAFRRRGAGVETSLAIVQGSATLNLPALLMAAMVFTPMLAGSRVGLSLVGALMLGPLVARLAGRQMPLLPESVAVDEPPDPVETSWREVLTRGSRDWLLASVGYLVRLGPIMVLAGFASALAIQWVNPDTVGTYLGDNALGVVVAATLGLLINVPLLFEIPLVAALLLVGMGTAPAAVLLFAAAAGGPITFWGLARVMPKKAVLTFATATWGLGAIAGLSILALDPLVGGEESNLRAGTSTAQAQGTSFFSDVTEDAGAAFTHYRDYQDIVPFGAGVVIFDYDGDGKQDIYVTSTKNESDLVEQTEGYNALYRNNGDGTFIDVAMTAGVSDLSGKGNGGCAADYDNDGEQDIFVANWGSSKLFQNNGDGAFNDVTVDAGLANPDTTYRSMGCAWGDYDQDGFLDLVVVRHIDESNLAEAWGDDDEAGFFGLLVTSGNDESNSYQSYIKSYFSGVRSLALYRNSGDGTFTEVTYLLGATHRPSLERGRYGNVWGAGFQPSWLDFDNDGDPDLYVVNDFGEEVQPNVLWRNDGLGPDGSWSFVDTSAESGADAAVAGMGLAVADYNLDGYLDFFITNMGDNLLLTSNRDGLTFTNTAATARVDAGVFNQRERASWGTVFFDYDNDGYEDLYVASGFLDTDAQTNRTEQPNLLYHNNNGDGTFTDVSSISGTDDLGVGRGVAYADFNGDGCLDLYLTNLGRSANNGERSKLFQNNCEWGNNWLIIKTVGTVSNRDGIGARVTVAVGDRTHIREVAAGSSSMSQNMLPVHFGLGQAETVDSIEILWPSGRLQTLTNVAPNQRLTVTEPP